MVKSAIAVYRTLGLRPSPVAGQWPTRRRASADGGPETVPPPMETLRRVRVAVRATSDAVRDLAAWSTSGRRVHPPAPDPASDIHIASVPVPVRRMGLSRSASQEYPQFPIPKNTPIPNPEKHRLPTVPNPEKLSVGPDVPEVSSSACNDPVAMSLQPDRQRMYLQRCLRIVLLGERAARRERPGPNRRSVSSQPDRQ